MGSIGHWEWKNRRQGMTLTELLVVIAVIAILVTLLIPAGGAFMERIADTQCKSNLNNISQALHVGKNGIPAVSKWTAAVVANATPVILACPKGGDRYSFQAPAPAGEGSAPPPQVPLSVAATGGTQMIATQTYLSTFSGTKSFIFPERKNVTLASNMAVSFADADFESMMYDIQANKIVPAGTKVDSYFMYYCDPWAPWGPHWADRPATITVTGGKVIGIIAGDYVASALYASDPIVGNPGTNYNSYYWGSWISLNGDDALRLSNGGTSLEIVSTGCWGGYIDCWRVLVTEVAPSGGGGGPVMVNWPGNYGMNNQVPEGSTVRPEQLVVTDYDTAVIDPDGNHQDILNAIVDEERLRHGGKMNALMGSGAVRAVTAQELQSTADLWKP
ncbi:MAG: prepilin-type N-terminal cleavage/methylation domain-containing protein [Planctomycetaceae bacterium]|nr:prepilin-type N-terminal cleavage/methylation domain-containing protein [Planctomycetaceae bacterium]